MCLVLECKLSLHRLQLLPRLPALDRLEDTKFVRLKASYAVNAFPNSYRVINKCLLSVHLLLIQFCCRASL